MREQPGTDSSMLARRLRTHPKALCSLGWRCRNATGRPPCCCATTTVTTRHRATSVPEEEEEAATAAASHCLVAALTHGQLGVSYDEACELLEALPVDALAEFEQELREELGQEIVGSCQEITVFDTATAEGGSDGAIYLPPLRSWRGRSWHGVD